MGSLAANMIGFLVVELISNYSVSPSSEAVEAVIKQIDFIYFPVAYAFMIIVTIIYEHPIRYFINEQHKKGAIPLKIQHKSCQRLLNEPFFLIVLNLLMWVVASTVYPAVLLNNQIAGKVVVRVFAQTLFVGIIITTAAFFILEMMLKKYLVPYFFPNGGLYKTPKTLHITIRTRLIALFIATNIIPLTALFLMSSGTLRSEYNKEQLLELLISAVRFNTMIFIVIGIFLVFLVNNSLTKPFEEIINVLKRIKKGNFEHKIKVSSNDEMGYTGDIINDMAAGLIEREMIKDAFGKYVSREVMDEVLSGRIPLDGEQKEVTVLFSDLRNFTPLIEQSDPKQAVRIMNMYFKQMADAIQENNGLILQFIGDEIYAVFGAPINTPRHPTNAVKAALAMKNKLTDLNREFKENGWPTLEHGIGVHSGEAVAANIGSPDRMSYLLVGNTVNISSRLQELNKKFNTDLIISQTTYDLAEPDTIAGAEFIELAAVKVKGITEPVKIFALKTL